MHTVFATMMRYDGNSKIHILCLTAGSRVCTITEGETVSCFGQFHGTLLSLGVLSPSSYFIIILLLLLLLPLPLPLLVSSSQTYDIFNVIALTIHTIDL